MQKRLFLKVVAKKTIFRTKMMEKKALPHIIERAALVTALLLFLETVLEAWLLSPQHRAERDLEWGDGVMEPLEAQGPSRGSLALRKGYRGAPATSFGMNLESLPLEDVQNKRWFVFQPSGGFNNQRIIMERALRICKLWQRTCVIPPAGRHSSMFPNYNALERDKDLMDMDRILDFELLSQYSDVVATSMPFEEMLGWMEKRFPKEEDWFKIEQSRKERLASPLSFDNLTDWAAMKQPVAYFAGPTMWQRFDFDFEAEVYAYIRYAPFFRALALDAVHALGLRRNFIGVHARQSDHGEKWEQNVSEKEKEKKHEYKKGFTDKYLHSADGLDDVGGFLLKQVEFSLRSASLHGADLSVVYIATKPKTSVSIFRNLTKVFKVFFSKDIPSAALAPLDELFPREDQQRLRNDILGIVEQLICAHSFLFVGFKGSSFSEYIERLRTESSANLFVPEYFTGIATGG